VFLAGKLSYFINELLEDKKETGFYEIKRAFSKKEIGILEKIASEHVLDEKTEAKRFLDYAAKEDKEYAEIWKKLGNFWHYMLPVLSERFNKHAMF